MWGCTRDFMSEDHEMMWACNSDFTNQVKTAGRILHVVIKIG